MVTLSCSIAKEHFCAPSAFTVARLPQHECVVWCVYLAAPMLNANVHEITNHGSGKYYKTVVLADSYRMRHTTASQAPQDGAWRGQGPTPRSPRPPPAAHPDLRSLGLYGHDCRH